MNEYNITLKKNKGNIKFFTDKSVQSLAWGNLVSYIDEFLYKNRNSYSFFYGEFSMRLHCFYNIQNKIKDQYKTFMDMLGGLGCTGKIFQVNEEQTYLNDLDKDCYELLINNFNPDNITNQDSSSYDFKDEYDLVLSDFNNLTIARTESDYKTFLDGMFNNAKKFVVITECSIFHLKYGRKSYENYERLMGVVMDEHTKKGFFRALKKYYQKLYPEWHLVHIEYFHASAYLLFAKTDSKLTINLNDRSDMIAEPPVSISENQLSLYD